MLRGTTSSSAWGRTHHLRVLVSSSLELAAPYALDLAQEQQLFAWGFNRPNTPVPELPGRKPGRDVEEARHAIVSALPHARGHGALWDAAAQVKQLDRFE